MVVLSIFLVKESRVWAAALAASESFCSRDNFVVPHARAALGNPECNEGIEGRVG